ncbi:hypothetical protein, partial [Marinovum sp.]|uniref:hypothetical protein n=1 Tax=Marinovum sp. TaxID=2024839 RepID=UPI002B27854D
NFLARPPVIPSDFLHLVCVNSASRPRRRPVWRPVVRLSAAGEGLSKDYPQNPQAVFHKKTTVS